MFLTGLPSFTVLHSALLPLCSLGHRNEMLTVPCCVAQVALCPEDLEAIFALLAVQ